LQTVCARPTEASSSSSAELAVGELALEAYGLDRADLDVIMATATPRMPGAAPANTAQGV
jgi:3-oxoacyl-[acyl-carrier-protein] synthase III